MTFAAFCAFVTILVLTLIVSGIIGKICGGKDNGGPVFAWMFVSVLFALVTSILLAFLDIV